jgi:hypothetical protein
LLFGTDTCFAGGEPDKIPKGPGNVEGAYKKSGPGTPVPVDQNKKDCDRDKDSVKHARLAEYIGSSFKTSDRNMLRFNCYPWKKTGRNYSDRYQEGNPFHHSHGAKEKLNHQ